jgi:hypothetical protein
MKTYKLKIYGWEFNGGCHSISDEQIQEIEDLKIYYDTTDISLIIEEISEVIEWKPENSNLWNLNRPFEWDQAEFTLTDEDDDEIWTVPYTQIGDVYELSEKFGLKESQFENFEHLETYKFKKSENTLNYFQQNKGVITGFSILSDTVPVPTDFGVSTLEISTNKKFINIIDDVFFKNQKLSWDFTQRQVNNKSNNLFVHTPYLFEMDSWDELTHE